MLIYDLEDFDKYSDNVKDKIRKAVIAVGLTLRDKARNAFITESSAAYQYHTGDISKLSKGILLGKEHNNFVKLHAMGNKDFYDSYKTRFFVGGTKYRMQTKWRGQPIKPFSKGYIKELNTVNEIVDSSKHLLDTYIKRAIDESSSN